MSKAQNVDFGVGREAFDKFHTQTFGEKRWKRLRRALGKATDLVAVVNPFVPPRWIAKELYRIGAEPLDILNDKFTKGLAIYKLSEPEALAVGHDEDGNPIYDFKNNALRFDAEGNVITRWPGQLPKVGFQPGDMGLDFDTTYINPSAKNKQKQGVSGALGVNANVAAGPQTFGGMKGRVGYYLLDAASICAPLILNPQPGEKVIDVCAAPGGKSLIMSYLLFARNELKATGSSLRDTLSRWRSGGVNTNDVALQVLRSLEMESSANAGAEQEARDEAAFGISDDEEEEGHPPRTAAGKVAPATAAASISRAPAGSVGVWAEEWCGGVPTENMDAFDEYHMRDHCIDESKVTKFLEVMFCESRAVVDPVTGETEWVCEEMSGVEEHILRGLMRNNNNVRIMGKGEDGKEEELDIDGLINRDLERERQLQRDMAKANVAGNHNIYAADANNNATPAMVGGGAGMDMAVGGLGGAGAGRMLGGHMPAGRNAGFLNSEYVEQQEKKLRALKEKLQGVNGAETTEAVAPGAVAVPEPEAAAPGPVAAAEEEEKEEDKESVSDAEVRRSKLVLNDVSRQRAARLQQVIRDYIPFSLLPSIDVINSDASIANNFQSITHNARGERKIASTSRAKAKKAEEEIPVGEFDCLLLDAPCSSDRHVLHAPDQLAHWTVQVTKIQAKRQIALLEAAVKSLKVGGRMVYSTCSLSPYENDGAVSTVVKKLGPGVVKVIKFKLEIGEKTPMGWLLLPDQPNCPWGPLYISYLQRVG